MKKKVFALCMCVAMLAVAIVGSSLAYFTDTDSVVNVMVSGNVDIVQNEHMRGEDGALAPFAEQKMLPAVFYDETGSVIPQYDDWKLQTSDTRFKDSATKMLNSIEINMINKENVHNVIDKIISVSNQGSEAAYIRTIVLFEDTVDHKLNSQVATTWSDTDNQSGLQTWVTDEANSFNGGYAVFDIDGTKYTAVVCTYTTALAADTTSDPSLLNMHLDPSATNESFFDNLSDGKYSVIALTQAVQAEGFDNVTDAFLAAFGEVSPENVANWMSDAGYNIGVYKAG